MKRTRLLLTLLICTSIFACRKKSVHCGKECTYEEELLFNFGFEDVILTQDGNKARIVGTDTAYSDHNVWEDFTNEENGSVLINYEGGDISERIAEIGPDPLNPQNNVLHYNIISPNVYENDKPKKARIQTRFFTPGCIKEYYQKVDIYFPEDMTQLKDYPESIYWLSIFEFWNNANWTDEKFPFRITVGLHKENGAGNELNFNAEAQTFKRPNNFTNVWSETATSFNIPFGQWMELEMYVLEGDESSGKFYMAVTLDGGTKEVLFDISNTTQHPKEKCADGFTHIHPLKWYTSVELSNFMKDNNKGLEIYWDNWEVWKNKKP